MSYRFLFNLIQSFSLLQQYFIILSISFIILLIFNHWWCIVFLPISTIFANLTIKHLCCDNQPPLKIFGYVYNLLIRKRTLQQVHSTQETAYTSTTYETSIHKECDTYIRTIIARYIGVWYYPLVSTDQEFPEDLMVLFQIILNRFSDHLKLLKPYDITRRILNLQQHHMEQYLRAYDSFKTQRKPNRISKNLTEEFGQRNGFHPTLINNDIHAYLKALVELIFTGLIPESFHIYSSSRAGREFFTQIIVNCIFLPMFNQFSKPNMLYYLIVVLWETEEQRKNVETNETSLINQPETIVNENEPVTLTETLQEQPDDNNEPQSSRLERIIYSATIVSTNTTYNSMSGSAYTVYLIECETKSPYKTDATHTYMVPRRFSEFIYLNKRLKRNQVTSRHCAEIDEVFQRVPIPIDKMNPEVISRRKIILEQYIQILISNKVLNCSHDVLEFFAYNSDSSTPFEELPSRLLAPSVAVLVRTLSDVGNKFTSLSTKRKTTPVVHGTFELNISTTCEKTSSSMNQFKHFIQQLSFLYPSYPSTLNSTDSDFLQLLLTRSSIPVSRRNVPTHMDVPLTDAILHLLHTCLHSRDTYISYQSTNQILRVVFGHFIEEYLKNQIDYLLSMENIITYLIDLRTKVLWPADDSTSMPMKNIQQRAFNACLNKVPIWLQHIVGIENIRRSIRNFLDCLNHEKLNQHFLCNLLDLFIEQLIPTITTENFLTRYVQMHAGAR